MAEPSDLITRKVMTVSFEVGKRGTSLVVVDVSDPTNPVRVGRASVLGPIADIVVEGERAYVVTNHVGIADTPHETKAFDLEVVDVSDPMVPKTTDAFRTSGVAREVAVTKGSAFVADGRDGLRVIDISYPNRPREVSLPNAMAFSTQPTLLRKTTDSTAICAGHARHQRQPP